MICKKGVSYISGVGGGRKRQRRKQKGGRITILNEVAKLVIGKIFGRGHRRKR